MATTYQSPGVYIEEVPAGSRPIEGVSTAIAAFVGLTERGPANVPTLVTNWGQYVSTFGDFTASGYTPLSVYNYFNNGGGACYVVRIGGEEANGNGSAPSNPRASIPSAAKIDTPTYEVMARNPESSGLSVDVRPQPPNADEGGPEAPTELFTLVVKQNGREVENHRDLSPRKGKQNAVTVVKEKSQVIDLTDLSSASIAERIPAAGEVQLGVAPSSEIELHIDSEEIIGSAEARSGLGGLEAIDDVTMVAAPDLMAAYKAGTIDLQGVQTVQQKLIDHCDNMGDRIAILDTPDDLNAQQVKAWLREDTGYDSKFAAAYWPWIEVYNPGSRQSEMVPPSGAMAGIWGRTDSTRGVHKAPANEVVRGATGLALNITKLEHDQLNPIGLNVIRAFPGRGIRVWGARTLSSDAEWRYLNVRRLFNYLEGSILNGTQWAVFEPNDLELWQRIKRTINGFLTIQWRNGALFGATPEEAFYVKCDHETNPPEVIEAGQVIVEIGVCPVKPAEFVVFRLAQLPAGGLVDEN